MLRLIFIAAITLSGCCRFLPAQSGSAQPSKKIPTIEDARTYHEAMAWVKKAQEMIGTPKENSDEQAELFLKALKIKPDFLEAHYNLGLIYANQKKWPQAVDEFEAVLKLDPGYEDVHYLLASACREAGNTECTTRALKEGIRQNPKDVRMLKALAFLQLNDKKDQEAIETLQRLLELEPADVASRLDLALLFQRNNDVEKAIGNYRDVLLVDSRNFPAHYNLALIYMGRKQYKDAEAELETANEIHPGNPALLERLGDACAFRKLHEKAVNAFRSALEKAPDRGILYSKLGFSLAGLGKKEEAVSALEKAVSLNPKDTNAYFLLGDLYGELKRTDDAVAAYQRSLKINPEQADVHFNLGTLFAENNKLDKARTELKFAVELDPDYYPAWANLASVAEQLELDKEAIEAHEKVVSLGKGSALNYFHLGVLYAKDGQPERAIPDFAKAIELEPEKYRSILREELKKVHSVLDSVRYTGEFRKLLSDRRQQ